MRLCWRCMEGRGWFIWPFGVPLVWCTSYTYKATLCTLCRADRKKLHNEKGNKGYNHYDKLSFKV